MKVLGRTNEVWPEVWLRPSAVGDAESTERLLGALIQESTVVDLSAQPGFWGPALRDLPIRRILVGGADALAAPTPEIGHTRLESDLFQSLCLLSGATADAWFLRVRHPVATDLLASAFEALTNARQDGVFRFLGLFADGPSAAVRSVWQLNDAFELLLIRPNHPDLDELVGLAQSRRVGIVGLGGSVPQGQARIVTVSSPEDVERALEGSA